MALISDIKKLRPEFQPIADWIILTAFAKYSTKLIINETLRLDIVQIAYYAQGREPLESVNLKRKTAKLYMLDESENNHIITNVQHISLIKGHGAGLAMDVIPNDNWNSKPETWKTIGMCVADANIYFCDRLKDLKASIEWGGCYTTIHGGDSPHIELKYH